MFYLSFSFASALNFEALSHCPQEPGMGACMFPSTGSEPGKALGYLMGDIVEEVTGVLRLSYYNGAKCEGSGRSHVVNIFFQCEQGSGAVRLVYNTYIIMSVVTIL